MAKNHYIDMKAPYLTGALLWIVKAVRLSPGPGSSRPALVMADSSFPFPSPIPDSRSEAPDPPAYYVCVRGVVRAFLERAREKLAADESYESVSLASYSLRNARGHLVSPYNWEQDNPFGSRDIFDSAAISLANLKKMGVR